MSLEKIKKDLNYSSTPFKGWMQKTINRYMQNHAHSLGYDRREEEQDIISSLKI